MRRPARLHDRLRSAQRQAQATEWIDVENPNPVEWGLLIDGFDIPAGSTAFDYARVSMSGSYGTVTIDDPDAYHPSNTSWSRTIHVNPLLGPGPLRGYVRLPGGWTKVDVRNVN